MRPCGGGILGPSASLPGVIPPMFFLAMPLHSRLITTNVITCNTLLHRAATPPVLCNGSPFDGFAAWGWVNHALGCLGDVGHFANHAGNQMTLRPADGCAMLGSAVAFDLRGNYGKSARLANDYFAHDVMYEQFVEMLHGRNYGPSTCLALMAASYTPFHVARGTSFCLIALVLWRRPYLRNLTLVC